MEQFAKRSDTERQDILQESAARRGIRDVVIEKDFWVCWTLDRLYALLELGDHITFKGGTSLSKAYGLIERFSEDIDLTIGRTAPHICDTKNPMEPDISGKERQRRISTVKSAAQCFVAEVAMPFLNKHSQILWKPMKAGHSHWMKMIQINKRCYFIIQLFVVTAVLVLHLAMHFKNQVISSQL